MSNYQETYIECKKTLSFPNGDPVFKKGQTYKVRLFVNSAVIFDENGALRPLYSEKDVKFYKEYFKLIKQE